MLRKIERLLFFSIILFLPTQLGKHFWPSFSIVDGIRIDYLSPTLYATDLFTLLLLVTYVLRLVVQHKGKISNFKFQISNNSLITNHQLLITLLFLAFLLIGIFLSHSPIAGFYKLIKVIEFALFGWYVATRINFKHDLPIILALLSTGILFETILAALQFIKQSSIGGIFWFFGERTFSGQTPGIANANIDGKLLLRPYGTFSHPNVLSGYLVISMTLIISNFKFQISNFKRIMVVAPIVIGTIGLLLTLSRAAIVLWILLIGFLMAKKFINHNSSIINRLVIAFVLIVGSVGISLTPLSSRFTSIADVDRETLIRRAELNSAAIEMVKTSPIFGVGLNTFLIELPKFQKPKAGPLWLQPVHNIFLLTAAETGIVGFLFIVWFMLKTVGQLRKKKELHPPNRRIKFQMFFAVISLGMVDHYFLTLQQGQLLVAFILGLVWTKKK